MSVKEPFNASAIWPEVKDYYEANYKVKFKAMPPPQEVEWLYKNMLNFKKTMEQYYLNGRPAIKQLASFYRARRGRYGAGKSHRS